MTGSVRIHVQIRGQEGLAEYAVLVEADSPVLTDLLKVVAGKEWGKFLFDAEAEYPGVKAGILMILNKRMVQPWDADSASIADGNTMRFVPVVAGGQEKESG